MAVQWILQTDLIKRMLYWNVDPLIFQVFWNVPLDFGIANGQTCVAPQEQVTDVPQSKEET